MYGVSHERKLVYVQHESSFKGHKIPSSGRHRGLIGGVIGLILPDLILVASLFTTGHHRVASGASSGGSSGGSSGCLSYRTSFLTAG